MEKVTGGYNQLPIVAVKFWKEVATTELLFPSPFLFSHFFFIFVCLTLTGAPLMAKHSVHKYYVTQVM